MFAQNQISKTRSIITTALVMATLFVGLTSIQWAQASEIAVKAQSAVSFGTSFSYQGQLSDNGTAANGNYDFQFQFLGVNDNVLTPIKLVEVMNVSVVNGLFNTQIDAGPDFFNGEQRLMLVSVRQVGETDYAQIGGPTEILPAPYAIFAGTAAEAIKLANPGETTIQVGTYDMFQSDGQTDASFAARGNGRMEVTRAGGEGTEFLYVPVDVPSQILGTGQKLKTLSFCYSGAIHSELGVQAGIQEAGVRQTNKLNETDLLFEDFMPSPLAAEDDCANITTDDPKPIQGSLFVRFKVIAGLNPLEFGEIKLTLVSE